MPLFFVFINLCSSCFLPLVSLLTLGIAQTSLTLLSLNRSLLSFFIRQQPAFDDVIQRNLLAVLHVAHRQ